jgi:uncharacterized protein (DUF983 family)
VTPGDAAVGSADGDEPGKLEAIWRGMRRRCPRCGQAPIFARWLDTHDRCASCGFQFEERAGDTWGFWVLLDRLFVAIPLVILLFGFATASLALRIALIAVLLVPLVLTMPHRQGVAIALDYLLRRRG